MASYLREAEMMEADLSLPPGGGSVPQGRGTRMEMPATTEPVKQTAISDPARPDLTGMATTQPVNPMISMPPQQNGGRGGRGGRGDRIGPNGEPPEPIFVPPEPGPTGGDDIPGGTIIPGLPGGPSTPPDGPGVEAGPGEEDDGRTIDPVDVQDLYPDMPEGGELDAPEVGDVEGAGVTEADPGAAEVGTPGVAETDTGGILGEAAEGTEETVGTGEQTELTPEQQVDAELARILGQDSPLLAQARAEAMRMANQRGLMNSSMAAGMTYGEMVKAAMPMAQQNADQAFQRAMENTRLRQEANLFTAEEQNRLAALEAELGQDLAIFNAEQLNQAEALAAELRTAIEQGNAQAYNEAALQLAELQRDAQAQQAELDYAAAEREFLERQAYNEQIIDSITTLNEQYMIGEQQIDIENIRGQYQQIISTNETAATLYDAYLGAIGQIFDDPKMSTAQAAEAIRAMVDMMEASFAMISGINDLDLDTNLPGGGAPGGGGGPGGGGNTRGPRHR